MTTKKQIKTLFARLTARNDDLVVKDHYIFKVPYLVLRPMQHVSRSISIDRTSRADDPDFSWHVGHCFGPFRSVGGFSAESFWLPRGKPSRWSEAGFMETAVEEIETNILPMLRRVQAIEDMFRIEGVPRSHEYDGWLNHYPPYRLAIAAALGRWEESLAVYEDIKDTHLRMTSWPRADYEKASELGALIADGDRAGVASLLHGWEDGFVARNGLEDIYERTPFPLELQQQP
ncbi:hypothetical protein [Bosea sp. MMO-172]|uniref:hypothetical protein n=1 Tax=Bosea sp. MMO-172 TaxID=3127885 RepID=UPI003018DE62